ncbi:hypothetical protein G6F43_006647 [Rhizopus delemar]|nr:hypothetical protein G6F43_006647 [Rhizopus delemar]
MKFYLSTLYLVALFFCSVAASPLNLFNVKLENIDAFQVAKMYIQDSIKKDSSTGDIIYPQDNVTWHVGENVNVTFREANYNANETVSIFIFGQTDILAGGPISQLVFPFTVPKSAYTGPNTTALLLAVRRINLYLQSVDAVVLHVV